MAVSEEEVKTSFARAKEDILQVKRSLNKQLLSVEQLQKSLSESLGKEEFYAFVKRLGSKIEDIENSFAFKSDTDDVNALSSGLSQELSRLRKLIERREELTEEIRQARTLRGKVLELEGILLPRADYAKDSATVKADISSLKSSTASGRSGLSSLADSISKVSGSLAALEGRVNSLSASAAAKAEISPFTERIESSYAEMSRSFSALKRDVDKRISSLDSVEDKLSSLFDRLAAAESAIAGLGESSQKRYADRASSENAFSELKAQLSDTRKLLESSISDVNMDDYVTKRSLKQQLSSVSESAASSVASRLAELEGRLSSLAEQVNSSQKGIEKRISKDLGRFAESMAVKRLGDALQNMESRFIPAADFYSKIQRIEESSAHSSDDFRKELKKQRELFEDKVKSLEAHHRSAEDMLKEETGRLRSHVKDLLRAGEHAKTEMARISVNAAKTAAKTATEILEELEREVPEKRRRRGFPAIAASVVIIALLVLGSLAYVAIKWPGEQAAPNEASPVVPLQPAPNASGWQASPSLPNITPLPTAKSNNYAHSPKVPANTTAPADRNKACRDELECTAKDGGQYWFDCYFDKVLQDCRCFVGSISNCPKLLVVNESEGNETGAHEEAPEAGKRHGARYFGIAAFVIAVVAFLAYRALFVKDAEDADEKPSKPARAEKQPEKQKPKEPEKEAAEDDDVIDLEEFFEKKEPKKK